MFAPRRILVGVTALVALAGSLAWPGPLHAAAAAPPPAVHQPTPPVRAADFPIEPAGVAPADNDGRIPNPSTPTGTAIAAPSECTVTFSSAAGATARTVNAWIAANENSLVAPAVVCLAGTFTDPLHVWGKRSAELLTVAPAPGASATLDLGQVRGADTDPNQYWSDAGGVSIVDSRSVEVYGLTVENYTTDGTSFVPAGIYVTVRSDTANTDQSVIPHLSACFLAGGSCADIYLFDNTVRDITNQADQTDDVRRVCGNPNVDGYGIAVIAGGNAGAPALQHVVVEDNIVTATRTGQSETMTFNGNLEDFLVAGNTVHDVDNIGIDTIGWETGRNQASHGLLAGNLVYDVDDLQNSAYGQWRAGRCRHQTEDAAGIYDDGATFIWIESNTVWNTNQGINLDVETPGRHTDHLLVSGNDVVDDPGSSFGDPSTGPNPPGVGGAASAAGHDVYAFFVDAFGGNGAYITDVYAHDNVFRNESQFYLQRAGGMPAVDFGGRWSNVQLWHNKVLGRDGADRYNPLLEFDSQPQPGTAVVNCAEYDELATNPDTVNGNFALPNASWLTLPAWQRDNGHGWDADSAVGGFAAQCPASSLP